MKKTLKKWAPSRESLQNSWVMRWLGGHILHPALWAFNRRSVVWGLTIGIACAFAPVPSQMVLAAFIAMWVQVNVPVAVMGVWISNPLTMVPMFYGVYLIGVWLYGMIGLVPKSTMTPDQLGKLAGCVIPPFRCHVDFRVVDMIGPMLLGMLICGILASTATYFIADYLWTLHTRRQWRKRSENRKKA